MEEKAVEVTSQMMAVIEKENVEPETSLSIQKNFVDYFNMVDEFAKKAGMIKVTDSSQKTDMQMARVLRLALRDIRIKADKKRKELKEDSLRYGKAVQGVYNVLEYMIIPIEKTLEEQENFIEIQAEKIRLELRQKRLEHSACVFEYMPIGIDLGTITEEQYLVIYNDAQNKLTEKIAYEKRLEQEKIDAEKARLEEIARIEEEKKKIEAENLRLKKERERLEAEERKRIAEQRELEQKRKQEEDAIKAKREAEERAIIAKRKAEQDAIDLHRRKEKEELDRKARETQERIDAVKRQEEAEKIRIENELQILKEEEERKAKEIPESDYAIFMKIDKILVLPKCDELGFSSAQAKERYAEFENGVCKLFEKLTYR
jgi:hypothetical protein